jgi:hypothetical protein
VMPGAPAPSSTPFTQVAPTLSAARPSAAPKLPIPAAAPAPVPLEKLVPDFDRTLAFVGVADGDTLPYAQATLREKGTADSTILHTVNGAEVSD